MVAQKQRARKLALPPPQVVPLLTHDNAGILLTRYAQENAQPVLLVHGGSVGSQMFTLTTTAMSFAEFLYENGFDVWIIDWCVSINLPIRQCTLTDVARYDFKTAVDYILDRTKKDSLKAVVHCIGALAFFVSVQRGWAKNVSTIAASAVGLHPIVGKVERAKTAVLLAAQLQRLGMTEVSPREDPMYPAYSILVRAAVNAVHRECTSTLCHKLTFMYGHPFLHEVMNVETHDRLNEQYGPINVKTLMHVEQCINVGHMQDYDYGLAGNLENYGSEKPPSFVNRASNFRHVKVSLFSGEFNQLFLPPSTLATYAWLKRNNPRGDYHREIIKGYGHWDIFAGADLTSVWSQTYLKALT
jgi:pimeloyl-ACP methyl ester carboxylesterase